MQHSKIAVFFNGSFDASLNPQHSSACLVSEVKNGGLHKGGGGIPTGEVGYHLTEEEWRARSSPELSLFASFAFQLGHQIRPHARLKVVPAECHDAINRAEHRQVGISGFEPGATTLE